MDFTRKHIRLAPHRYRGFQYYFLTLCCHDRQPLFHDDKLVAWLTPILAEYATRHAFALNAYCFMPDHLHLLIEGRSAGSDAVAFVTSFKQTTAYQFQRDHRMKLWQRYFYDHILRPDDSADAVAWYIWLNPVRAGRCQRAEEYPYSGSFTTNWKMIGRPGAQWTPPWKSERIAVAPDAEMSG